MNERHADLEPEIDLREHLLTLELELLSSSTRKDAERLSVLLSDDFREFGSSGRVYSRAEIIDALQQEVPAVLSLSEFAMQRPAPDVAHVTYRSDRESPDAPRASALRSSLWVREAGTWKMLFHQGTPLPGSLPANPAN